MRKIPRSKLPLISSRQLTRALERLDATQSADSPPKGSHAAFFREVEGRTLTAIVVLGKREIARGTLQDILFSLDIGLKEFTEVL